MTLDKKLNLRQLEAVNHGSGPLLIIAGAGTGKTTVITERVKRLISQGLAQTSQILALTFTEKSAKEMEERIDVALPYGYTQLWVMTFHSFCERVLKDDGIHIGLSPDFKLIMSTDIVSLLRKHLFQLNLDYFRPLGNPNKFISGMVQHFDRLRDEDILPQDYKTWLEKNYLDAGDEDQKLDKKQYLELADIYAHYQKIKVTENFMDFSDLVTNTLKLFRTRPNILKKYQQQFKYILVDEFQDTNYAQNQLVNLLAGSSRNLTVVADDDQSIYRWRGAAVSNVLQFKQNYPDSKLVVLTDNYRSGQEILDSSYKLIQNNNPDRLEVKEKINKQLISSTKVKSYAPEFLHYDRIENEADGVAKKIKNLIDLEGYLPKSFAILVRANAHAQPFMNSLSHHGIPYQYLGPGNLFDQPEIKDLIAYLHVLHDFSDDQSLFRLLSMDYFSLPVRDLVALSTFSHKFNQSLFYVCEQLTKQTEPAASTPEISENTKTHIIKLVEIINRHIGLTTKESAGQILFYFLQDTGLLKAILDYKLPVDERIAGNITKFFNKLKSFEFENKDASVSAVLDWIELSYDVGESPAATNTDWTDNDAVSLLTIHSAKGLEFPVVFLVNLVSQRFPTIEKKEQLPIPLKLIKEELPAGDYHLQEERRLFYVGMTRARERLYLTASDYYGEAKRIKKISPFVYEALGENPKNTSEAVDAQLTLLDWQKPEFSAQLSISKRQRITIDYLSYSQIQTFLDCPLHYKAKYIFNIVSPASAASSFGNTIHKTLKDYHAQKQLDFNPDILGIFSHNWTPEGYHNAKHAQLYFDKGVDYLEKYLQSDLARINPILLEESFVVPLNDHLKIGGKIDRVNLLKNGKIEIIDYKTSVHLLTEKQAATDLQLSFYSLAAHLLKSPPFNKNPEDIIVSLYYFEEQKKVSVTQSKDQLELAKQEIFKSAQAIENSDFRCSASQICKNGCDYKTLCDTDFA